MPVFWNNKINELKEFIKHKNSDYKYQFNKVKSEYLKKCMSLQMYKKLYRAI